MNRRKKFDGPKKRSAFIDGIVSDGRTLGVPTHRSYRPGGPPPAVSLGDSSARLDDGFHPLRQSPGGLGVASEEAKEAALLDEPIILDDIPASKAKKSRHKRSGRPSKFRRVLKKTAIVLGVGLAVYAGFLTYKVYNTQRKVLSGGGKSAIVSASCDENVPVSQLKKEGDGRVNILLLGVGGEGHEGADLTDTIMIASIDPVTNKIDLLSVPRDLWVRIPGAGSHKINEAYYYGKLSAKTDDERDMQQAGIAKTDQVIEQILGIKIHYNALVSFKAFQDLVDSLGGVDLNVGPNNTVYEVLWVEGTNRHYVLNVQEGVQHFDGTRALYYSRSRYTSARGDFDRSERQRLLMVAIKDKALSAGTFANPLKISSLLDSLGNNVYTDFDTSSIKCLYKQVSEVQSSKITSLDLVTPPHDLLGNGNIPGVSTLAPKAGSFQYDAIQDYVRTALRDGFLQKENASVAVYNATSVSGLATKEAKVLKSYGYNTTVVENAPNTTNPTQTQIIDLSKGKNKYTRNYLQQRFGVTADGKVPSATGITPPPGTSFVIILGQDVAT